jgi:hypothetical protein
LSNLVLLDIYGSISKKIESTLVPYCVKLSKVAKANKDGILVAQNRPWFRKQTLPMEIQPYRVQEHCIDKITAKHSLSVFLSAYLSFCIPAYLLLPAACLSKYFIDRCKHTTFGKTTARITKLSIMPFHSSSVAVFFTVPAIVVMLSVVILVVINLTTTLLRAIILSIVMPSIIIIQHVV